MDWKNMPVIERVLTSAAIAVTAWWGYTVFHGIAQLVTQ